MAKRIFRHFMIWAGLTILVILFIPWQSLFPSSSSFAQEQNQRISEVTSEEWMQGWMKGTKAVGGALDLRRFKDPFWLLLDKISWKPNPGEEPLPPVTVPKGTPDLGLVINHGVKRKPVLLHFCTYAFNITLIVKLWGVYTKNNYRLI